MRTWALIVWGKPRTKKTSSLMTKTGGGRPVLLPSKAWRDWLKTARIEHNVATSIPAIWDPWNWRPARKIKGFAQESQPQSPPTLIGDGILLNCRARFFRDARRGDAVGFYQGLADLLQDRGVVVNDRQLVSWDGTRLDVDPERPRIELILEEVSPLDAMTVPDEEPGDKEVAFP